MRFGTAIIFVCLALATAVITAQAQSSGPMWGAISPGSYPTPSWGRVRSPKPFTAKQRQQYKTLRDAGLTKRDARQVARDPGVKKNEWGWACESAGGPVVRMKGEGSKYRKNAVCE
jgi:hypothetical protein